jgi:hypothetical protein
MEQLLSNSQFSFIALIVFAFLAGIFSSRVLEQNWISMFLKGVFLAMLIIVGAIVIIFSLQLIGSFY